MTVETEQTDGTESNFTEFEAEATKSDAELTPDVTTDKIEPLELGSEEAPVATDEEVEADEKRKGRSHSPVQRINQLTARLRDAERRAAELEARTAPQEPSGPQAPDPNDATKYEFGTADPQYIKDAAIFEVRQELASAQKQTAEHQQREAAQNAVVSKLGDGMASIEKAGPEKYDDFEQVISDAVEARGGEPLPPLLSIGIAVSPAGADISYHLAKNEAETAKLEKLAQTSPQAAAVAFGELEGQYLDSDDDLDLGDQMDMARMLGRMKARLAGKSSETGIRTSKAPDPPEHRSRGSNGKFETTADTTNFPAFEAMANKKLARR